MKRLFKKAECVQKLDISTPGLFVIKLNRKFSDKVQVRLTRAFKSAIDKICPESAVLVLSNDFEAIATPTDKEMKKLGWIRKV